MMNGNRKTDRVGMRNRGCRSVLVSILMGLFAVLFVVIGPNVYAQNARNAQHSMSIKWRPIAGANGYAIEIKNEKGVVIKRRRVKSNRVKFRLKQGKYFIRIASLNRFRKPSVWSAWRPFFMTASKAITAEEKKRRDGLAEKQRKEELRKEREQKERERYNRERKTGERKKEPDKSGKTPGRSEPGPRESGKKQIETIPDWQTRFIPGVRLYRNGDSDGAIWLGGFFAVAVGRVIYQQQAYRSELRKIRNMRAISSMPIFLEGMGTIRTSLSDRFLYYDAIRFRLQKLEVERSFNRRQRAWMELASLYAATTFYSSFTFTNRNGGIGLLPYLAAPGWSQYRRGDRKRAYGMGGVFAGALYYAYRTNRQYLTTRRAFEEMRTSSIDPITLSGLGTIRTRIKMADLIYDAQRFQAQKNAVRRAGRRRRDALTALGGIYFFATLDAFYPLRWRSASASANRGSTNSSGISFYPREGGPAFQMRYSF